MNRFLPMLLLALTLTPPALAQESAEMVGTDGTGELRRASEHMIAPTAGNILARIPDTITKGEVIKIEYQDSGTVSDSFMVTGIAMQGERCKIESRRTMPDGPEISDMIFVRYCRKMR